MVRIQLDDRLDQFLVCPHDLLGLATHEGTLVCSGCGRRYPLESGTVHLVTREEERPGNPKRLAASYAEESSERLQVEYYEKQRALKEQIYSTNSAVKEAVDFVVRNTGTGVDLATGHGGGYIAPIVKRLSDGAAFFASDACLPVIENWCRCLQPEYADRFAFLDIDLNGSLCFPDNSVDVFSGLAIGNVNDGDPAGLLREVHRCLRPGGWGVFQEMFFAPESETAALLSQEGDLYASVEAFAERALGLGLHVTKSEQAEMGVGKIDPADGMPVNNSDGWSQIILYLRKV